MRLAKTVQFLSKTQKALVILNATLQVSSGALGTMLNFVDENKYPKFCEKLRNVLLLIDLATLGGDFVTNSMLKKAAQDALDTAPSAIRNDKRWAEVEDELELLSGLDMRTVKPFPLGIRLEVLSSNLLRKYMAELMAKMQRNGFEIEIKWIDEIEDLNYTSLHGRVIVEETGPIILLLRKDCSKMAWFHENIHIDDLLKFGRNKYRKMMDEEPWTLEWSVWEGILKNRNRYREVELVGAYEYVKGIFMQKNIPFLDNKEMEQLIIKYNK